MQTLSENTPSHPCVKCESLTYHWIYYWLAFLSTVMDREIGTSKTTSRYVECSSLTKGSIPCFSYVMGAWEGKGHENKRTMRSVEEGALMNGSECALHVCMEESQRNPLLWKISALLTLKSKLGVLFNGK